MYLVQSPEFYGVPRGCFLHTTDSARRTDDAGRTVWESLTQYARRSDGVVVGTLVFTIVQEAVVGHEFVPAKPYRLDWGFSPLTEAEQARVAKAVYAWLPAGEEVTEVFGDWDGWGWEPNEDGIVSVDVTVHTTEGAWLLNVAPDGEVVYEDFSSFAEADLGRSI